MNEWYIYKGKETPSKAMDKLPGAPKWRQFGENAVPAVQTEDEKGEESLTWVEKRGMTFEPDEEEIRMVNAALYLRRPLLITGNPGSGKSSLAYSVAYRLNLGKVLYWPITTRTTLIDGLYNYDAIGRLQELQIARLKKAEGASVESPDIGQYIRLGPLGTAFLPSKRPRVLLIDEIDKSDIDLPNDLLNIFEEGRFEIPELSRLPETDEDVSVFPSDSQDKVVITKGRVVCDEFPFVVLTSNAERELPAPFLRRCLRLDIKEPSLDKLKLIVKAHFGNDEEKIAEWNELITTFFEMSQSGNLATDQLLNAIYLTTRGIDISTDNKDMNSLRDAIFKYLSTMGTT